MIAIQKHKPDVGGKLIETDKPGIQPNEVLVKVEATSICGTDVHIFGWDQWSQQRIKPPMIFGHEFGGTVVEVGEQVGSINVGDHVSAETHIPCGFCYQCRTGNMHICSNLSILGVDRDGCFAEYVAVPEICCWKNPDDMDPTIASIQEPFGNATYTVQESNVAGKTVAIFGDGPIGMFAAPVARALGATQVVLIGMNEYRMGLIEKVGVDHMLKADECDVEAEVRKLFGKEGPDVVLEMSGSPVAIDTGLRLVKKGGTFTFFGIPSQPPRIDIAEGVIFKGIKMIGINGRKMFETWYTVRDLLSSGRIDVSPIITHKFHLKDFEQAFDLVHPAHIQAGKIVLYPHGVPQD